jgi:SAM-dependent methyltransferase
VRDWDSESARLAARALAAGRPTAWFEELYAAAARDEITMPWDRAQPSALLADWLTESGAGRSAVVVGCGLGADAEFVAGHGFATTAFDISETAVRTARERYPASSVRYRVADLLAPPAGWAFNLVVEIITVQALPVSLREEAVAAVAGLVAPRGTLLVVENARAERVPLSERPPWAFTRAEIASFAGHGLETVTIERLDDGTPRWRAEFTRLEGRASSR